MKAPGNKHSDQPQYEGGQAAALRDTKKINELKNRNDLKNPETAFEVYEHLVENPYYFESEIGKQFQRDLLKTAIHSDSYLFDEKVISGRMNDQEFHNLNQAVEIEVEHTVKSGRPKRKNQHHRIKVLLILLLIICLVIFGKSLYEMIDYKVKSYQSAKKIEELISCILEPVEANVSEEHRLDDLIASGLHSSDSSTGESTNSYDDLVVLHQYSELFERNSDMAGWISIDDTIINYPVMLTKEDEEYYLKRDFDKNNDLCGLPFMDKQCDIDSKHSNYLIYGHNMKNGSMFSTLLDYEDFDYYEAHNTIRFDTIYEEGIYDIVAVFQTQVRYQDEDSFRYYTLVDVTTEEAYNEYVKEVEELSIYNTGVTATYGDQLLVLSTCDRRIENGRFVVIARKKK